MRIKVFLTLICGTIYITCSGQFALISNKDSFSNIRNGTNITDSIVDILGNGQVIYCLEAESGWAFIDYQLNNKRKNGYLQLEDLKFIRDFDSIPIRQYFDSIIIFNEDSISLTMVSTLYLKKIKQPEQPKRNSGFCEFWHYVPKIETAENVPHLQYKSAILKIGNTFIKLPVDNLFEPNLELSTLNIDKKNNTIYLTAMNGDGAGSYTVLWIIVDGQFKQRIITIPF